jgi:ATP-dependent helicase HepA
MDASLRVGLLVEDPATALGIGRLAHLDGQLVQIEYFDRPGDGGSVVFPAQRETVARAHLPPQTRVHTRSNGAWQHGRVLEHDPDAAEVDVRFAGGIDVRLPEDNLCVRWRRRLHDATELLADAWVESRRFHDARSSFVHAYVSRTSAYQGLTAISSSGIEVHPHQLEAMRRILTDVTPRYLLADEVGLGKTIEAGLVVRQHLLDDYRGFAVVIAPSALVSQWEAELQDKFRVFEQFPGRCAVFAFDVLDSDLGATEASLVVVDEAHRLASDTTAWGQSRYEAAGALAMQSTGLLLLTATPLLLESQTLLRLLHLLSPDIYGLDEVGQLEHSLGSRDEIATYLGNLSAEVQKVFLRSAISGLRNLLPDDTRLGSLLSDIENALVKDDCKALKSAIARARSHVTEAHRIHSRMVRSRRGSGLAEGFPVLGREEPQRAVVEGAIAEVAEAYAAWHESVVARLERETTTGRSELLASAGRVVSSLSSSGGQLARSVIARLEEAGPVAPDKEERALLQSLLEAALERERDCPRLRRAIELTRDVIREAKRVVVVVGHEETACELEGRLASEPLPGRVSRIAERAPNAVADFMTAPAGAVLVIGPTGEEGQNLQAGEVVIHVDLPWDPNRLEQRLGRFDRFGAGIPATQYVLADDAPTIGNAWIDLLSAGFGIFSTSVASVQLAIARVMPSLLEAAVIGGAEALSSAAPEVRAELDAEYSAIELAELLDETAVDERGERFLLSVEAAESVDATKGWQEAVVRWAAGDVSDAADLRFHHEADGFEHRFALTEFSNPIASRVRASDLPLVPWTDLRDRFSGAMPKSVAAGTFRRLTAVHRGVRLFGPGDPFVDALWAFTEEDDRGRAFAVWRRRQYWAQRPEVLTACFDFRIRPSVAEALDFVPLDERDITRPALQRRAESYLPPLTERVWLNIAGGEVKADALLKILNGPFSESLGDETVRPSEWHLITEHVSARAWYDQCAQWRGSATRIATERGSLRDRCMRAAEQCDGDTAEAAARLAVRARHSAEALEKSELELGAAISRGIREPLVEVDAVGVVVLSSRAKPQADA